MMPIFKTKIFVLSILSSTLLLVSTMYGQKLFSELWVIDGFIDIGIILLFSAVFIWSIVSLIRKKTEQSYLPFLINITFLILIIALPLNWIRNRVGFWVYKNDYEKASRLVYDNMKDSANTIYKLPHEYQSLSVGGGEALAVNNNKGNAVLFFTFRGTPDGLMGFLKVIKGKNSDVFTKNTGSEITEVKDLGDGWYYIKGN